MIRRKSAEERFPVTAYFTRDEYEALRQLAEDDDRSLSSCIRKLLKESREKGDKDGQR
jgi:hypothetical protein